MKDILVKDKASPGGNVIIIDDNNVVKPELVGTTGSRDRCCLQDLGGNTRKIVALAQGFHKMYVVVNPVATEEEALEAALASFMAAREEHGIKLLYTNKIAILVSLSSLRICTRGYV